MYGKAAAPSPTSHRPSPPPPLTHTHFLRIQILCPQVQDGGGAYGSDAEAGGTYGGSVAGAAYPTHAFPGDSLTGPGGGEGLVVAFRDLSYSITKDGKDVDLITDISAFFMPGRMAAIMGPSGAGKVCVCMCACARACKSGGTLQCTPTTCAKSWPFCEAVPDCSPPLHLSCLVCAELLRTVLKNLMPRPFPPSDDAAGRHCGAKDARCGIGRGLHCLPAP